MQLGQFLYPLTWSLHCAAQIQILYQPVCYFSGSLTWYNTWSLHCTAQIQNLCQPLFALFPGHYLGRIPGHYLAPPKFESGISPCLLIHPPPEKISPPKIHYPNKQQFLCQCKLHYLYHFFAVFTSCSMCIHALNYLYLENSDEDEYFALKQYRTILAFKEAVVQIDSDTGVFL